MEYYKILAPVLLSFYFFYEDFNNPCSMWFCNAEHMINGTKFFAAAFDQVREMRFPLAWDLDNLAIPGVNRTDFYQDVCNKC